MSKLGPLTIDLIERGAAMNADRVALVFEDGELSFAEVNHQANQLAHALSFVGANHRSRVALLVNNSLISVPLDFGCVKAGVNRVPLNARLSLEEHVRMVTEAECGILIFSADLAERAAELVEKLPSLSAYGLGVSLPDSADLAAIAADQDGTPPQIKAAPDDIILTLYTSGTTGVLKAAQHTQASFAAICRNILLNLFPISQSDAMMHAASLIHASGTFVLPLWLRGGRSIILSGFVPQEFLSAISHYRPTAINLVPTMLHMLLEQPDMDQHDLSSLNHIIYGASPMPRTVIERAIDIFGQDKFWQYFGQTEAPLALAVLRPEDHVGDLLGACGRPAVDVELRLIDEKGKEAPQGEPGEILVRSPSSAAGYFKAPDLSRESFDADGWVHTRDIGVFDERGFLFLRDRTSDMIVSGGYNVYPKEVEDVLMDHDAVLEACVVGAPDAKWVEAVTAFIVLRPDHQASEADLISHASEKIASYKKPRRIIFTDSIPKTAVGKVNRKVLREKLQIEG